MGECSLTLELQSGVQQLTDLDLDFKIRHLQSECDLIVLISVTGVCICNDERRVSCIRGKQPEPYRDPAHGSA